jgi:hypothetical protein
MNIEKYKKRLEHYGLNENSFQEGKSKLSKRFKHEAADNDVIWFLYNSLITNNIRNLNMLQMIYYEMSVFLDEEGKNSFQIRQLCSKMELSRYRELGIEKVTPLPAKDSCRECKKLQGKIFSISRALKEMPLPYKKCSRRLQNDKYAFCRCCWITNFD